VLDGVLITFRVRPGDVLRYRETLRTRLAAANRRYAEVVIPRALAREAALQAKEEERRRIIVEAQRLCSTSIPPSPRATPTSRTDRTRPCRARRAWRTASPSEPGRA
jgi:hypothetical protein